MRNPVFLITGAGKGIGRAIALELCSRVTDEFRPRLFLVSRTEKDLQELAAECRKRGAAAELLAEDLKSTAAVERAHAACVGAFGGVDCLVNNAGVGRFGDFLELTEEDLDYVIGVNLKGTFLLTQKVFGEMQRKRSGHIFFVTSVAAEKPFPQSSIYCMSKFAQKGLLEVLRLYARDCNVRVTNVMPGAVETPMWGPVEPAMRARMMSPEDIAKPVVDAYLLPTRASVEEIVIRPIAGDL